MLVPLNHQVQLQAAERRPGRRRGFDHSWFDVSVPMRTYECLCHCIEVDVIMMMRLPAPEASSASQGEDLPAAGGGDRTEVGLFLP